MNLIGKRVHLAGAIVLATALIAGCGGDDDGGGESGNGGTSFAEGGAATGTPTSQEVVGCLKTAGGKNGFTVSESPSDLDTVAKEATDRAVLIDANGEKTMVVIQRTQQEADTVVDQYQSGPIEERGAGYAQSGTIVLVDKGDTPDDARKAIVDCTKFGTKAGGEDDGADGGDTSASTPTTPAPSKPEPLDLDANTAKVYDRSEVADADFGTLEIVKVQDPRPGKSPFLPAAGKRFIGVTFKLTGKAKLSYRGFSLYGKNDKQYYEVPDPDAFSAGTIDKGETKRAFVIFEVTKSVKAESLRFHVDAPLGAEDSVEIRLK